MTALLTYSIRAVQIWVGLELGSRRHPSFFFEENFSSKLLVRKGSISGVCYVQGVSTLTLSCWGFASPRTNSNLHWITREALSALKSGWEMAIRFYFRPSECQDPDLTKELPKWASHMFRVLDLGNPKLRTQPRLKQQKDSPPNELNKKNAERGFTPSPETNKDQEVQQPLYLFRKWSEEMVRGLKRDSQNSVSHSLSSFENSVSSLWHTNFRLKESHWVLTR